MPIPLIPFFRQFFAEMQRRYPWRTREDWYHGYQAFAELEEQLMSGCLQQLIDSNDRIYRLLDSTLNGTQYSESGAGVISPAIPTTPISTTNATNAMRAHISRIWQLLENDIAGVTASPGESIAGAPALPDSESVRDVIRRLLSGTSYADPNPADNVLMALRGTLAANADRNVVDKIVQLDTLLEEIRDLLQ